MKSGYNGQGDPRGIILSDNLRGNTFSALPVYGVVNPNASEGIRFSYMTRHANLK